ncbi:MAG: DUF2092 domain-containing protein [Candidatus Omnitrophica bacterium]|nr:DUF2092 domain-containing protein [Candidatus Omnitrophota bacterium]MCB9769762.1 DUF2092 domain-containing protein [Candidatus Omnitrophota bacterium]
MQRTPLWKRPTASLLGLLLIAPAAFGAEIDPKAQDVLNKMADYLESAKSYQVSTTWITDASAQGLQNKSVSHATVALERPNKFAFRLTGDSPKTVIISDGKELTSYLENYRSIAKEAVPDDFSSMAGSLVANVIGQTPYHGFLFTEDVSAGLVGDASKIAYHGIEEKDGVKCHHLEVFREGPGFQLYIQEGDQPVVRAIVPDTKMMEERLSYRVPGIQVEISFSFDDWKVNQPIDPSVFAFTPPEDTFKKDTLFAMIQAGPPHALLGKKAPTFSLTKLDGTEFDLSENLGDKVIVLDFWSMRCGPCVSALPTLAEVAKEYKDKGVVLLAVNLGEPQDMITSFLENKEVDLPVGLDMTRLAATTYQVGPIPQTVIIGKNGVIENVHIGLPPDLKSLLTKELDTLIAGKSLLD